MFKQVCVGLCVGLLALAPSYGDDESDGTMSKKEKEQKKKAEDLTPSPLTELRREHFEREADPVDPIEYLRSYRDWIAENATPPPRTERDRGVYDVWTAHLKPRVGRMVKRVDTLMQRKYWEPEVGTPQRVKPEAWSRFTREIAGLGTELHGAWKGYNKAQITDRRGMAGVPATRTKPPSHTAGYFGYGHPGLLWRGAVLGRQSVGDLGYGYELRSYRHLLDTYRRGWGWRRRHCSHCEIRRRELQKKKREYVAERKKLLHTTRDTLEQQMLSLQVLAAAMQAIEEDSLRKEMEELPRDHMLREPAVEVLTALRDARLKAERYSGTKSSEYGQLLRGWVRAYKAGMALLKKEVKKAEKAEAEAAEAAGGD